MRAAFLGTSASAIPALAALRNVIDVEIVITRPDASSGRSRKLKSPPVKLAAVEWGLDVVQPATSAELLSELLQRELDVGVVVAYGRILESAALATVRVGFVNLHFSVLPRWRGAAPVERAILAGDTLTGVSLMLVDEGLDTGPVIAVTETDIDPEESAGELTQRLSFLGAHLLEATLEGFLDGSPRPTPQMNAGASHAARLTTEEARLDPGESVEVVSRKIRAYNPRPGAWLDLGDSRLKVWQGSVDEVSVITGHIESSDGVPHLGMIGGSIRLDVVQAEGRRRMSGAEWWRGLRERPRPVATADPPSPSVR